ncbi:hypothetical protein TRV_06468 [Trichophyton verrucosum HKI 0517]|uniref:Uncharacterized protein n=1 Tax=Trichophyton verrucosum (strain HKI 0517) TaxID=663202 RepID=D4DH13_TRIVH|nr:uncharacterized protein TRV_06468 [Trichophyton verrucosum HKI 0517]EFE38868.1 hypothetical protein TRV_06468 [Trichophyton verrucosum HKI 0517]
MLEMKMKMKEREKGERERMKLEMQERREGHGLAWGGQDDGDDDDEGDDKKEEEEEDITETRRGEEMMDKKRDVRDLDYGIQTWLVHPTAVRCLLATKRGETSSGILWLSYNMQTAGDYKTSIQLLSPRSISWTATGIHITGDVGRDYGVQPLSVDSTYKRDTNHGQKKGEDDLLILLSPLPEFLPEFSLSLSLLLVALLLL